GVLSSDPPVDPEEQKAAMRRCIAGDVASAARELYGPKIPLSARPRVEYMPRPHEPASVWALGPHVDAIHPTFGPDDCGVSAFVFLTPLIPRGGTFWCAPGSPTRVRAVMTQFSGT